MKFQVREHPINLGHVFLAVRESAPEYAAEMLWAMILMICRRRYEAIEPVIESMVRDYGRTYNIGRIRVAWANRLRSYVKDKTDREMFRQNFDPLIDLFAMIKQPGVGKYTIYYAIRKRLDEMELDEEFVFGLLAKEWNPIWLRAWKDPAVLDEKSRMLGLSAVASASLYWFVLADAVIVACEKNAPSDAWKEYGLLLEAAKLLRKWAQEDEEKKKKIALEIMKQMIASYFALPRSIDRYGLEAKSLWSLLFNVHRILFFRLRDLDASDRLVFAVEQFTRDNGESNNAPAWASLKFLDEIDGERFYSKQLEAKLEPSLVV